MQADAAGDTHSVEQDDVFLDEVLANHFRSVVEEMSWIVLRAAHTNFVREIQDYATTLATVDGEMFAYPHTTGVTSLLGMPLAPGITAFDDWAPGDILLTNDPYSTRGMVMHLPDLTLLKPIFADGQLLCFAWAFMHCTDVGGAVPGSTAMASHEVYQEGVRIRPVKLYNGGRLNEEIWTLIADNCRIPSLNWGDVSALVAALNTAERRMSRLAGRYGRGRILQAASATLKQTEKKTRAILARIPRGSYRFVDYLEDDIATETPVRIELEIRSTGLGQLELDFTGSDPQVRSALNLPTGGQKHHPFLCISLMNYVITQSEGMHLNAGILRCIDLTLPDRSIVNAQFPAACGARYLTAMRIHDVILGALSQAVEGAVPAAGAGGFSVTVVSAADAGSGEVKLTVATPVYGGSGGGPTQDGITGLDYPLAFFRNVPAEIVEADIPILIRGFGVVPDSEGPGRFRGGFGVRYEIEVLHPSASVIMRGKERYRFQPWGSRGGQAGTNARTTVQLVDGSMKDLGKTSMYSPASGEVITITGAGGGGYGDPLDRPAAEVQRDYLDGLITLARARERYGVVLDEDEIDAVATAETRQAMRGIRRASIGSGAIDYGSARESWDRDYGEASSLIRDWLLELPAAVRSHARESVYAEVRGLPVAPTRQAVSTICVKLASTFKTKGMMGT